MNRPARFLAAISALSILGIAACDSPTASSPAIGAPSRTITVQADLGAEIRSLVTTGFPKGQATAILAKWDQVLKAVAKEPKMVLKGKTVPGTAGRAELARTVSYIQLKATEATPPTGETQAHFVARMVLDMSLYVYGGPTTQPPPLTPTSDVAYAVVQPTENDTVVTPAEQAAVVFPVGAVSEPTIVVITPIDTYYPDNCSGPLITHLCQYPRFYHFNVFPDVKLNSAAKVQVCHVDAGTSRLPLADHDRFRITHERPANAADYTPGATQVEGIEILPLISMNVTKCTEGSGTTYTTASAAVNMSPMQRLASVAAHFVSRASSAALSALLPKDAYAIDVGGGGSVFDFSIFGVVDPDSKPDLAQSTAPSTRFHPNAYTVPTGGTLAIAPWNVTNAGSGTSGAFTSKVIVASDSLLTSPVSTTTVAGAASLVPGASFTFGAQTVTMPTAPGTYFIGTRVFPAAADSTSSDDWTSMRVVVNSAVSATSCENIRVNMAQPLDGDYLITANGHTFSVYCAEMIEGPALDYLTLASTGAGKNFATWGGDQNLPSLTTTYSRVRLNVVSLKVATADTRYAVSTAGPVPGPGHDYTSYPFANAGDCQNTGSNTGAANVDLTGTPFQIHDQFWVRGYYPYGTVNGQDAGYEQPNNIQSQIFNSTGGGYCGGTSPVNPDSLQLEFVPTSLTHGNSIGTKRP